MRKKDSIAEFSAERSECLLRNFRESLARQSKISVARAFGDAVDAPAPRFWVSEVRALKIVRRMLNGDDPTGAMNREKVRMYHEIFKRVLERMEKEPETPLGDIVFDVVNSPAPSSYLEPTTAKRIINSLRKIPVKNRRIVTN